MRFLSWKNMPSTSTMTACHMLVRQCLRILRRQKTDERELKLRRFARLGSRFLLRNSRIKLHPQQWNRMNRATRANALSDFKFNLSRGVEQQ